MEKFDWAEEIGCGVTVSDLDSVVIYQNKRARKIFESYGNLIGKNLKDCHSAKSWEMIQRFLETGESNSYTIEKNGVKKLIHQYLHLILLHMQDQKHVLHQQMLQLNQLFALLQLHE